MQPDSDSEMARNDMETSDVAMVRRLQELVRDNLY